MYKVIDSACGETLLDSYYDSNGIDLCLRFKDRVIILRGIGSPDDKGTLERCRNRSIRRMIVEKVNLTPLNKNRYLLRVSTTLSSHIVVFESVKDIVDIEVFKIAN